MFRPMGWIQVAVCLACLAQISLADDASDSDGSKVVERRNDFFAARGRRSDGGPKDFFWANRGKKSASDYAHVVSLRDKVFNAPRPNGFLFPTSRFGVGKRSGQTFNVPRPNGFFFPSSTGKRNAYYVNNPKPNGFFFPSKGKRGDGFNLPSPNGFLFPTKMRGKRAGKNQQGSSGKFNMPMPNGFFFPSTGKRSSGQQAAIWNLAKPNGFFFPSVQKPKRSSIDEGEFEEAMMEFIADHEDYADFESDVEDEGINYDVEDEEEFVKRSGTGLPSGVFYGGRGKKSPSDIFFSSRGKKSSEKAEVDEEI